MKIINKSAFAIVAGLIFAAGAFAQTPTTTKPASPHHGLLSMLHKPKPAAAPGKPIFAGNIIGNKNTHVYHLPSDKSQLPQPQNRVYFRTEAQAIHAGYHHAGHGGPKAGTHKGH